MEASVWCCCDCLMQYRFVERGASQHCGDGRVTFDVSELCWFDCFNAAVEVVVAQEVTAKLHDHIV